MRPQLAKLALQLPHTGWAQPASLQRRGADAGGADRLSRKGGGSRAVGVGATGSGPTVGGGLGGVAGQQSGSGSVSRVVGGTLVISIFASVWVVNATGLPLAVTSAQVLGSGGRRGGRGAGKEAGGAEVEAASEESASVVGERRPSGGARGLQLGHRQIGRWLGDRLRMPHAGRAGSPGRAGSSRETGAPAPGEAAGGAGEGCTCPLDVAPAALFATFASRVGATAAVHTGQAGQAQQPGAASAGEEQAESFGSLGFTQ
ncbi:hypothetical protein T492DRAFT_864058, partial [Pavlovales sp. CCMP2436]